MMRGLSVTIIVASLCLSGCQGAAKEPHSRPDAERDTIATYTTNLVFGKREQVEGFTNKTDLETYLYVNDKCTANSELYTKINVKAYLKVQLSTSCKGVYPFDTIRSYRKEGNSNNPSRGGTTLFIDFYSKELPDQPTLHVSDAKRFRDGYFAGVDRSCRLYLARDLSGRIEHAALQIKAKGRSIYDPNDDEQQECLVRSIFTAQGLYAGVDLPFSYFAVRKQYRNKVYPVTDMASARENDFNGGVRYAIPYEVLHNMILPVPASDPLRQNKISRSEFYERINRINENDFYGTRFDYEKKAEVERQKTGNAPMNEPKIYIDNNKNR